MKNIFKLSIVLIVAFSFILLSSCTKEEVTPPPIPTPTTGDATFWIASDLGVGSIAVTCNGVTQTITGYFNSGVPSCGASGSANFNLNAGSYPYSAVAGSSTWSGTITITGGNCTKQQLFSGGSGSGGGTSTGDAMFWTASDLGVGNISVTCNGSTKSVTGYFSAGTPSCGSSGAASFTLNPGTYPFNASGGSLTWSGTITVTSNGCSKFQLTSSGSGGGGGTTTGQAMFWTASDLGVGNITVTCNGSTKYITGYSSAGAPSCGSSGAANFTFNPGTYSFNASGGSSTWSGTITVTNAGCSKFQLTSNGSGGGGGSGGNCNWGSAINCVTVLSATTGTRCGTTNSVEIVYKNNCTQNIKTYICIQNTNGTWSGHTDGTFGTGLGPNETATVYECQGTGQYAIYAMPISDYNANSCPWPTCN
ncbi:MAG: hypothetical protein H7174_03715 [Flavobacterium sp.]|nr:hypothetical protein [Flavobacterium sp.]